MVLPVAIWGGRCRDRAPGQQQWRHGGSNPAPGGPGGATTGAFCFFFGLFGSGGEKAKPEKTGKSFLRKRKNLPKWGEKTKKNLPKTGPAPPQVIWGRMWGKWGRSTPENGGFGGPARAPGAIWAEKWGFWDRVTAQVQTRNGDWGHRRVPVAKWGWREGFGAPNGFRSGGLGLIPRPRHTTRSEKGIWGRPAQNQLKNEDFGVNHAPPSRFGLKTGDLGVGASRGPAGTYSARSPFPASLF